MVDEKTTEQLKKLWAGGQNELGKVLALLDEVLATDGIEAVQKLCREQLGLTHSELLSHAIITGLMNDKDTIVINVEDDKE